MKTPFFFAFVLGGILLGYFFQKGARKTAWFTR